MPPAVERTRNLKQRVVTALVVAPPALGALWLGAPVLAAFLAIVALLLAWEWDRLCGGRFDASGVALAVGLLAVIAACGEQAWALALALVAATAMAVFAVRRAIRRPAKLWSAFGAVYIGLPIVALLWLRAGPEAGRTIVFWVAAVAVATDIGGYAAGRLVGGPKLAPAISPHKTWAGAAGGTAAALVTGFAFAYWGGGTMVALLLASVAVSLVAQGGDLLESAVKRRFGVKDTSGLMPGHGGLFDRVDGLLAAFAFVGAALWIFGGSISSW